MKTTQGSLAGMTLADICYAAVFAKVLHIFHLSLEKEDLVPVIPASTRAPEMQLVIAAYADDVVAPCLCDHAKQVVPKSLKIVEIAKAVFLIVGLILNLKKREI